MQTQHAPGPWHYETADGFCGEIVDAGGDCVAAFFDDPSDQHFMLLTAAPDLLEALQQYGIGFTDESAARAEFGDYEVDRELRRRAAIAKATGEQP